VAPLPVRAALGGPCLRSTSHHRSLFPFLFVFVFGSFSHLVSFAFISVCIIVTCCLPKFVKGLVFYCDVLGWMYRYLFSWLRKVYECRNFVCSSVRLHRFSVNEGIVLFGCAIPVLVVGLIKTLFSDIPAVLHLTPTPTT
jgi:hypothetical protein